METSDSANFDDSQEETRSVLQTAVSNYVATSYPSKNAAAAVYYKDGKFQVLITGEVSNLKNYWSGRWNSTWSLTLNGSEATVSGEVKVLHCRFIKKLH